MTNLATIPGMAEAQAAVDAVRTRIASLTERLAEASQAVADAKAARATLVSRMASGDIPKPADVKRAETAISDAEATAGLLAEAIAAAQPDLSEAMKLITAAKKAEGERMFAAAVARRIAAAERMDELGRLYQAAVDDFLSAAGDIQTAWTLGRVPNSTELSSLRDQRLIRNAIPGSVQQRIIQTGSVYTRSIGATERGTWGDLVEPVGLPAGWSPGRLAIPGRHV
jgi:hypothetical protein